MKNKVLKMMIGTLCVVSMMGRPATLSNSINESRETTNQSNTATGADNRVKIFYTDSKEQFDRCTEALENRNGEIIVEVVHGTVLDDEGNGQLDSGYYIKYHTGKKGDRIESIFVYNADSTALDDVEYRQDTILK